jgi:hypothetical protein
MSTKYQHSTEVPTEVLAKRLDELSDAVVARMNRDNATFEREFTCRIPAELDRDADLVLSEAASRLIELKEELTKSTDQNDLVLDEFVRVKCLTDNTEIHQLCERAHIRMRQNVSVIDRNHKLEVKVKELEKENEKLKERNRKLDVDLLRGLFYAPSSPVSAKKAQEIEVWYGKFKQVQLAAKGGE